ncbi:MAG: glycosyltransferase [Sphingomicrobium sp.]
MVPDEGSPCLQICHVIESASGGSAAVMADLALHAVERGHRVDIVYAPGRADQTLLERLRAAGCGLRPCRMQRSIGLHDARDAFVLWSTLRSLGKIDVIHSHSSKAGALSRLLRPGLTAAQIYSPHGFYTMTGKAPAYIGTVERLLGRMADRIIAVSKSEADHGVSLGIPRDRLIVIPNGIDPYAPLPRSEARARMGLCEQAFVVGFVGRFVDQKDPASAVAVIDLVDRAHSVTLAMIGDGDLRAAVERTAATAAHPVRVLGAMAARPLLSAFDCLLCTSRYEGMAVTFLEALNCGVPIVTYSVAGADELVVEPATGFVTTHDPAAAAGAIETLVMMDGSGRTALAERCRTTGGHFSAKRMGDSTLALYEQVIARRTRRRVSL